MNIGIKQNKRWRSRMWLILGLASLLLSACAIQGVAQPAADVEATVAAAVEATMAAERAAIAESTSGNDAGDAAIASENAEGEAPMLITPTPDRSAEISQFVVANTRRFRGNPDASVVLIEFSDFQ